MASISSDPNDNSVESVQSVLLNKFLWRYNDEVIHCFKCRQEFKKFTRPKHHCRLCGYIFCSKCANERFDTQRVCALCVNRVQRFLTPPSTKAVDFVCGRSPLTDVEIIQSGSQHYKQLKSLVQWFGRQFGHSARVHVSRRLAMTAFKPFYGNGLSDRVWEGMCFYLAYRDSNGEPVNRYDVGTDLVDVNEFFPMLLLLCMQSMEINDVKKWCVVFHMLDMDNDGLVSDVDLLRLLKRAVFSTTFCPNLHYDFLKREILKLKMQPSANPTGLPKSSEDKPSDLHFSITHDLVWLFVNDFFVRVRKEYSMEGREREMIWWEPTPSVYTRPSMYRTPTKTKKGKEDEKRSSQAEETPEHREAPPPFIRGVSLPLCGYDVRPSVRVDAKIAVGPMTPQGRGSYPINFNEVSDNSTKRNSTSYRSPKPSLVAKNNQEKVRRRLSNNIISEEPRDKKEQKQSFEPRITWEEQQQVAKRCEFDRDIPKRFCVSLEMFLKLCLQPGLPVVIKWLRLRIDQLGHQMLADALSQMREPGQKQKHSESAPQ